MLGELRVWILGLGFGIYNRKGWILGGKGLGKWGCGVDRELKVGNYCKRFRIWDWLRGFDMGISAGIDLEGGGFLVGKGWRIGVWTSKN